MGRHRLAIPDLPIASCARQHGSEVLHVDRGYEALAGVLSFTPRHADSAEAHRIGRRCWPTQSGIDQIWSIVTACALESY
jgi:hypothetical protein